MASSERQVGIALDARSRGTVQWPQFITNFLLSYLESNPPRSVLDVTADIDGVLPAMVQRYHPDR